MLPLKTAKNAQFPMLPTGHRMTERATETATLATFKADWSSKLSERPKAPEPMIMGVGSIMYVSRFASIGRVIKSILGSLIMVSIMMEPYRKRLTDIGTNTTKILRAFRKSRQDLT